MQAFGGNQQCRERECGEIPLLFLSARDDDGRRREKSVQGSFFPFSPSFTVGDFFLLQLQGDCQICSAPTHPSTWLALVESGARLLDPWLAHRASCRRGDTDHTQWALLSSRESRWEIEGRKTPLSRPPAFGGGGKSIFLAAFSNGRRLSSSTFFLLTCVDSLGSHI